MVEQNRDNFYEGPPLEDPQTWHEGAVTSDDPDEFEPGLPLQHERAEPVADIVDPLVDVDVPERGAYPLPEVTERPHEPGDGLPPATLTRDPSMSRAVDRVAAGVPLAEAGYDRSIEGEAAGPLAPAADTRPDEELPAGQ